MPIRSSDQTAPPSLPADHGQAHVRRGPQRPFREGRIAANRAATKASLPPSSALASCIPHASRDGERFVGAAIASNRRLDCRRRDVGLSVTGQPCTIRHAAPPDTIHLRWGLAHQPAGISDPPSLLKSLTNTSIGNVSWTVV